VAEVSPSGLALLINTVLPKEKGTVLTRNVLELVIQPADTEEASPGTRRFPVASTARGCDSKVSTAGRPAGPSNFKFRFIIIIIIICIVIYIILIIYIYIILISYKIIISYIIIV
jgi:hypothetical protein